MVVIGKIDLKYEQTFNEKRENFNIKKKREI